MSPPSSGGIAVAQTLGILQRIGAAKFASDSLDGTHLFAEAGRLVFADRARYLADPDFVPVPTAGLVADSYLSARARLVDSRRAQGVVKPGEPHGAVELADSGPAELPATTHLSIVDSGGNGVAMTSSIESGFGSRIMVRGFLLNNQLTDFSFASRRDGKLVANRLEPLKRPMSSMAPTIVLQGELGKTRRRERLEAILGSPGGPRIINYTARATWAMLADGWLPGRAVALAHVGNRNGATELEAGTDAIGHADGLRSLGHEINLVPMTSGLHAIRRRGANWVGAADPRREGLALGR
jgi:gamma-glutamyltranspeptidase/glutathione hydrolase